MSAGLSRADATNFVNRGYFDDFGSDVGMRKHMKKQLEKEKERERLLSMVGFSSPTLMQRLSREPESVDLTGMDIDAKGFGYSLKKREVDLNNDGVISKFEALLFVKNFLNLPLEEDEDV